MSPGAILIGIAIVIGVIPFVVSPLLNKRGVDLPLSKEEEQTSLEKQHQQTLLALRDLEFDHQVGKVGDEDYNDLRSSLLVQAAASLEAQQKVDAELDNRIEEAIRLRREKQSKELVCRYCSTPLATTDRFCRACGEPVESTCPKCSGKMLPGDLYCNTCGALRQASKTSIPVESI